MISSNIKIYNYFDIQNFKVEQNKEDLIFYDPEQNMNFFNKLFMIIGTSTFLDNISENIVYSDLLDNYLNLRVNIIKDLRFFYNPLGHN
jgi:hypothetical protein